MISEILPIAGYLSSFIDDAPYWSLVIFTQGCNLNCSFCQNKELISIKNNDKNLIKNYYSLWEYIYQNHHWIESFVFTGGEPCIHKKRLVINCVKLKTLFPDKRIKLFTNGWFPDVIEILLKNKLLSKVELDIKNIITKPVQKTYELLKEYNVPYILRIPNIYGDKISIEDPNILIYKVVNNK